MTAWRSAVRDAFKAGLDAFMVANEESVEHVYSARPASITDRRVIFIGGIAEDIAHDSGTRRRTVEVTLVITRALGENSEAIDDLEDLADLLVDYLSDNPHLTSTSTLQEPVRTVTTELPDGGTFLPAVAVVARAYIQEGRT